MKPIEMVLRLSPEMAASRLRLGTTTQPFQVSVREQDFVIVENEAAPIYALEGFLEERPDGCVLHAGFGYHPVMRLFFQIWLWTSLVLSMILLPITYLLPMSEEDDVHFLRWGAPAFLLLGTIVSIAAKNPPRHVRDALLRYLDVLFKDVRSS